MVAGGKVAIGVGGLLLLLLFPKKKKAAPPAATPAAPFKPKIGGADLSNGAVARFTFTGDIADESDQTYVRCEDLDGNALDDAQCSLVRREFPEIKVPVTALIRMTTGRTLT